MPSIGGIFEQHRADRAHAAADGDRCLSALQIRHLRFKLLDRRVRLATVLEVRNLAVFPLPDLIVGIEGVGRALVDRHAARSGGGIRRFPGVDHSGRETIGAVAVA